MSRQGLEDWAALGLLVCVIVMIGVGIGYSTCRITHRHYNSCEDGSTRCMTK